MATDPTRHTEIRVCVVLFRWDGQKLLTATFRHDELPTVLPPPDRSLDATAVNLIRDTTGSAPQYLEQLYTFNHSTDGGYEVVVTYMGLFSTDREDALETNLLGWSPVDNADLRLEVDRVVLEYALVRLRAKLGYTNIAFYLMPETFTLSELQLTYEHVLADSLDKRNFRRRMVTSGILEDTGDKRREGSHRPATLYRFVAQEDHGTYLTPSWQRR